MRKIYFRSTLNSVSDESRTIKGLAIVFNRWSNDLGGFIERILPEAIDQELIDRSDIIANVNHDSENYIMARCKNGQGTLKLELREDGLHFEFEAPETAKGDDLLFHVRNGNINECSFAFTLANDGDSWYRNEDNQVCRDIRKISGLYDVAVCNRGAYSDTYAFATRNDEECEMSKQALQDFLEAEKRSLEAENTPEEATVPSEEETRSEELKTAENENPQVEEEVKEELTERNEESTNEVEVKSNKLKMNKEFRLLTAIRNVVENRTQDAVSEAVLNAGREEMRSSGLQTAGQIQLPVTELRDAITVSEVGEDVVPTDLYDILAPLRAKNVLVQAGAKFMTGLVGDVQVPLMGAGNVNWEGETSEAQDAGYTFSNVKLSPKRLSAVVILSKQFLAQDAKDAESLIRMDLVNAINAKLESTLLSADAGTSTKPEGIFYTTGTTASVKTYKDVADLEASIEDANINGECKYVMSNKAKAFYRTAIKGNNNTGMIYENGGIDGTQVLNTSHVPNKLVAYGDWSNLAIGQWSAIDLVVDPYTLASSGQVRLVVNAFFDAKVLRPEAFAIGKAGE